MRLSNVFSNRLEGEAVSGSALKRFVAAHMSWVGKISGAVVEQGLFAGTNFIVDIFLARLMAPEAFGAYVVVDTWFLLTQNLHEAFLTEPVAILGSGKYDHSFKRYLAYTYVWHVVISLILALVLGLAALATHLFDTAIIANTMLGVAIASPLLLSRWFVRQPFYVMGKPYLSAPGNLLYLGLCLGGVFLLSHFQILTPFSAFLLMGVASICYSVVLTVLVLKPAWLKHEDGISAIQVLRDHLNYGKWASGSKLANWVPSNIYYVILPTLIGLSASAALRALNYMVMPLNMGLAATVSILIPIFSRTYTRSGKDGLKRQIRPLLVMFVGIASIYCLFVTVFGQLLVNLLYGGRFDSFVTVPILLTMGLAPIIVSANVVLDASLRAMGNVKQSFYSTLVPAVLILTLGVWLLSRYGLLGANLGSLAIGLVATFSLVRFYRQSGNTRVEGEAQRATKDVQAKRAVSKDTAMNFNAFLPLFWPLTLKYVISVGLCLAAFAVPMYLFIRTGVDSTQLFAVIGGGSIALLAAVTLIIRQVTVAPLKRMRRTLEEMAGGNYKAEVFDRQRGDEIGQLAASLVLVQERMRKLSEDRTRSTGEIIKAMTQTSESVAAEPVLKRNHWVGYRNLAYWSRDKGVVVPETKADVVPVVSVVMPAYNTEKFIAPAIESILNQTLTEFEFIIVDDGSTDKTLKIIQDYARRDSRIRILRGNHGGVAAALNLGLNAARCSWVAIMHADDVALPKRLSVQWEMAQTDPEVVIWGTDGFHISANGHLISRFRVGPTSKEACSAERAQGVIVQAIHPTVMLNREVALRVGGYNPNLQVCEDIELFDRMMNYGALVTIPEQLMQYRVHGSSLSMKKYLSQGLIARYVMARQKQRLDTGTELSLDAFMTAYEHESFFVRLRHRWGDVTGMYYRRAGLAFSNKQYGQLFVYFAISTLLSPSYAARRVWTQLLSPESRHTLHATTSTTNLKTGAS